MSRWRNHGGWNKKCGQIEKASRIDSFDVAGGVLFACRGNGVPLVLACERYTEYGPTDRDFVEVLYPKGGWSASLELSHKVNGYGGRQTFFLCPACGIRARYLYQAGGTFLCRKCARLNYKSQQETRSDSMYYYDKGMALVEKHLEPPPRGWIDGFSFCGWVPERPRYMHQTTYGKYLRRFTKYQDKHQQRELEDLARLLRIFK